MAHVAASPRADSLDFPGFSRFSITASDLLRDLLLPGQWYVGYSNGTPSLTPASDISYRKITSDYLAQRDALRRQAAPPRPAFWADTTLRMAARQFECGVKRRSFAQQTRVTKIIFDKYFHGENRAKGCTEPARRDELLACTLCGDYDSEEHGICHCQGPPGDNLLQPIRSTLFQEITAKINSIPFGPVYEILALYRDLATDSPHPQRVWKGLLSPLQRAQLLAPLSSVSPKEHKLLLASLRHVQTLFSSAISRLRTQLTSYAFPHMRGGLPPPATAAQTRDIGTMRGQPRITDVFGGADAEQRHGRIASRNVSRRRRHRQTPARSSRRLRLVPLASTSVTPGHFSPTPKRRSVWDTPSPSPSVVLDPPSLPASPPVRTRVSRILVSPSPPPTQAPPQSQADGLSSRLAPQWWTLPTWASTTSASLLASTPFRPSAPSGDQGLSYQSPSQATGSDPLG
jgi:hypothetical protein